MPISSDIFNFNVDINTGDIVVVEVNEMVASGGTPGTAIRTLTSINGTRSKVEEEIGSGAAAMRRDDNDQRIIFDQVNATTGASFSIAASLAGSGSPVTVFDNAGKTVTGYTMSTELLEVVVGVL